MLNITHRIPAFSAGLLALITSACGSAVDVDAPVGPPSHVDLACSFAPGDHSTACAGASCPFQTDVEMRCDDHGFPYRLEVAAASDTTYALAGDHLASFQAGEGESRVFSSVSDPYFAGASLAVTPSDGRAYAALGVMNGDASHTRVTVEPIGGEPEQVDSRAGVNVGSLMASPQGDLHAWLWTGEEVAHATRGASGWTLENAAPPADAYRPQWALGADGRNILFYLAQTSFDRGQIVMQDGANALVLADDVALPQGAPAIVRPAEPASSAQDPREWMAVMDLPAGLSVAWSTATGFDSVALDGTALLERACGEGGTNPDQPCPTSCTDDGVGVPWYAFDIARTDDGVAWVTYVVMHSDIVYSGYEYVCNEVCTCEPASTNDNSQMELHVVKLANGAPPATAFVMDLPGLKALRPSYTARDTIATIDAHALGSQLAIAVAVHPITFVDAEPYVRVLRLDTSTL